MKKVTTRTIAALLLFLMNLGVAWAQNGPVCDTLSGIIPDPAVFPGGGNSTNIFSSISNRVQCFYDSSNWTGQGVRGAIKITKLDFRAFSAVAANRYYPSVQIYVQKANVDYLFPNTRFANNRTSALGTPNYSGPLTVNAVAAG
jgi:hypothetical protein